MCLLIVVSRVDPEWPLVVAANRDERLDRPAVAMTVLRSHGPRVLGGRDELAKGTWLAVNEAGVVAGLTNQPASSGPDPTKRSRGELPLALCAYGGAATAVEAFIAQRHPRDYNPAVLIVGDRSSLYYIDMTGDATAVVVSLPPGVHVVENQPFGVDSAKVEHVRRLLNGAELLTGEALVACLQAVLSNHDIPSDGGADASGSRPAALHAACIHTPSYGTRWAGIVTVPALPDQLPRVLFSDGPSCVAAFNDASYLWSR